MTGTEPSSTRPTSTEPTSTEPTIARLRGAAAKDVVLRYFAALAAGDQQAIRDSWAVDGTCWYGGDLPISGLWRGRDRVIDGFLATAFAHLDPEREIGIRVTNVFGEGEQVFVEWDSWATGRTGRPYRQANSGVFSVRGGQIATMREYADTQGWERALIDGAGTGPGTGSASGTGTGTGTGEAPAPLR
ncbi:nuclear transport factor 2 family protein [Kitasatospora sp. NBC_01287]|uniref:nuclear transport factor 2 family protein n=1 Tax=Kitasatospora sp. NBC_01287 TaxID=2903573 RepID=UPI00225A9B3C|nr:nuclear transport factor 2 family protein [Kitasatospora sp. NBC_01287]MCX4745233.1 nuclear transport factor 2 family protein [Kitasatospora sp. NBC_01287]